MTEHGGSPARVDDLLALGEAAKLAPGRPSANCVWRWCRRGVLSRSGERVHLRHVRLGGKILTTAAWLSEFGRRLAEADAEHFRLAEDDASPTPFESSRKVQRERFQQHRRDTINQACEDLKDAGL